MAGTLDNWIDSGCVQPWDGITELTSHNAGIYRNRVDFIPANANGDIFNVDMVGSSNLFQAVARCSPLAAIISRLADAYANGKVEVLNRNTQNYVRGTYKDWERLMDKPNKYQSRTDFRKQLFAFTKINGWCYVQPEYAAGFVDRPSSLHIIAPWMIQVEPLTQTYETLLTGQMRRLWFVWGGVRMPLDEDKLILFKDTNTDVDQHTGLPKSRLIPLSRPISNIVAVEDAENNLVHKRGGIGFISNDAGKDSFGPTAMSAQDKLEAQQEFQRTNGLTSGRNIIAILTSAAKWNQMAFNTKELMLLEIDSASTGKLCDGLGYPFYLLSGGKGSTFANVGEAEKALYQNAIIPMALSLDEQLNEGLETPANNIEIRTDYSHIEALQQSEKEKADALKGMNQACLVEWEAGSLTLNEWRMRNGDDKIKGEQYDMRKPEYDKWLNDNGFAPQLPMSGNPASDLNKLENGNTTGTQGQG
jgi:HK97 family phage portal protein